MKETCRAAVLTGLRRPLKLMRLDLPELRAGQVLVDVHYTGVCQSQLLEIDGKRGVDKFLPHTLGHEGSGVVVSVGPGVRKVKRGDHVVLTWIKGRGADVPSAAYMSGETRVNSGAISTFLTRAVVSENRLVPIPKKISLKKAAFMGCAVMTGAGTVKNVLKAKKGDSVAVFGVGGIGAMTILALRSFGVSSIVAVDIADRRLKLAKSLGAAHAINALKKNALAEILKWTGGRGVDFAVEAAGHAESIETAFKSVRARGGLCVVIGNLPHGQKIGIDPFDLIQGRRIVGSWGGESDPDRDIPLYIRLFQNKKLPLERVTTREFPLNKIGAAIQAFRDKKVGRVIVACGGAT